MFDLILLAGKLVIMALGMALMTNFFLRKTERPDPDLLLPLLSNGTGTLVSGIVLFVLGAGGILFL
jgi:hypothetical protein